jgi:tRNA modification GTPase
MNILYENDTIAALATARGNAALAIIRISGKNAFNSVEKCIFPTIKFINTPPKRLQLFTIINIEIKKAIDEVTAIKYENPQSYTGENMVEILCHGNEIIIEEILSQLIKTGVRIAEKGEFTKRAFLNGKMDLLKAESINELIASTNPISYLCAIENYYGKSKNILLDWKAKIIKILAEIETRIEFPEEDDVIDRKSTYRKDIESLSIEIEKELNIREKIKVIDSGFMMPIVGIANAGKSSLFNLILGYNRTIVHHEEGTTRDAVSEEIKIKGEKIKIFDTAGLNETKNSVELMGIEKSWEYIKNGNLLVFVTPANKEILENEKRILKETNKEKIIGIISKKDLNNPIQKKEMFQTFGIPFIEVNLIEEEERLRIIDFISSNIKKAFNLFNSESSIICNKRQEEIIRRTESKIKSIIQNIDQYYDEIISNDLKEILYNFEEFIGTTDNEEILEAIFSEFCIGK